MLLRYFQEHYQDNVIAGFINSLTVALLAYFIILKKILVCQQKLCFRIGHHKVDGTHYKTCPKHTTRDIHRKMQHQHYAKYPKQHEFLNLDK